MVILAYFLLTVDIQRMSFAFFMGRFAAPAASFFLDAQKEAKEAPGDAPIFAHPLDPHLRGPPMRRFFIDAKARVAQLIGFPSITAAAKSLVTFG